MDSFNIVFGFGNGYIQLFDIRKGDVVGGWKEKQVSMIGDFAHVPSTRDQMLLGVFGLDGFSISNIHKTCISNDHEASGVFAKAL